MLNAKLLASIFLSKNSNNDEIASIPIVMNADKNYSLIESQF